MTRASTVHKLQRRIDDMQPMRLDDRALPTPAALRHLLPEGALRRGSAYSVCGSHTLALSLLGAATTSGLWCAVIGCPTFGAEAAVELGIALDRCALIPNPGDHSISLAGLLSEAFAIVALHTRDSVNNGTAERIAARLREHGSALIVLNPWPRAESTLTVTASRWSGLGQGEGMLEARELSIQSKDRRGIQQHTAQFTRRGPLSTAPSTPVAMSRELVAL